MTDRERFEQIAELFEAARSKDTAEREALLLESKATNPGITAEVRRLLHHHESAAGPLSEPIVPSPGLRPELPPLPPAINQYRIIRQIGAGGMGVVYLAEQDKPRREVAIKVIRPGLVSPSTLKRFDAEAAMLGRLRHPGVAQIYEAGTFDDGSTDAAPRPYFAMEYIDGLPLLEYAETNRLSVRDRVDLMARVADAVQHAHQQGVVHRDLKPGNILVDHEGNPKILDFGVARATDAQRQTLNTVCGELVGTVGYMSPEQIDGDPDEIDTRTDIHALGVILYELLAGRLPYDIEGVSLASALRRIREDTPTPLGAHRPTLRGDPETICATALETDKARRYQSASGLAADLRRYLRDEPIAARPPSTLYLLGKFTRRNRALVAAASLALFFLFALLAATSIGVFEVSRQRDEAVAAASEANAANRFLADTMMSLDPRGRGTSTVTLEDFLDGVTARLEASDLSGQPKVEAAIRGTIGIAYSTLEKNEQAREQLRRSLLLFKAHDPGNLIQIAGVTGTIGSTYLESGEFDRAEPLLTESLGIMERVIEQENPPPAADSHFADALHHMANLRIEQRRLDEAEELARRALAYRRHDEDQKPDLLARTLNTLAVILRLKGDLEGARAAYEKALAIQRRIFAEPRLDTASTMNNLALLYLYDNRPDEATPLLAEALHIRRAILPVNHPHIAGTLNSLGGAMKMRGDLEGAADAFREALQIRLATLGDNHPAVATSLINLGTTLSDLGRPDQAASMLEEAAEIRKKAYGDRHIRVAAPLTHLGRILTEAGRFGPAEASLRDAIEIYEQAGRADSTDAVSARATLGHCLAQASRFDRAEPFLLDAYAALAGIEPRSPLQQRSLDRTADWIRDLYRAWSEADPDAGLDTKLRRWEERESASRDTNQSVP